MAEFDDSLMSDFERRPGPHNIGRVATDAEAVQLSVPTSFAFEGLDELDPSEAVSSPIFGAYVEFGQQVDSMQIPEDSKRRIAEAFRRGVVVGAAADITLDDKIVPQMSEGDNR